MSPLPVSYEYGIAVITVPARLTIDNSEDLRWTVGRVMDRPGTNILLDVSCTEFMDPAGLGDMVRCYTEVSRNGGTLKLLGPLSERTNGLLTTTKLHAVFETHTDRGLALASFRR